MANIRNINSPGVEVREIDLSTRAVVPVGTNVLVAGFAPQGPTYEIVNLSTLTEFEQVYGTPSTAAERYFYYSVRQLFTNGSNPNIKVARLPYGSGAGEGVASSYSALAYPVLAIPTSFSSVFGASAIVAGAVPLSSSSGFLLGEPALVALTESQYDNVKQGNFTWSKTTGNIALSSFVVSGTDAVTDLGQAGLIVLNQAKTSINEKFEGYYFNLSDSFSNNPATDYDDVGFAKTVNSTYFTDGTLANVAGYTTIPDSRIGFSLSAAYTSGINSMSQDIENLPTFNIAASGFNDTLIASLFRLRPSPFSPNTTTLQYVIQEGYTGSLYAQRTVQDPLGGQPQSFFLETIANDNSNNITVLVNPNMNLTNWLDGNGNSTKTVRMYKSTTAADLAASIAAGSTDSSYSFSLSATALLTSKPATFNFANNVYALGVYSDTLPTNDTKIIGDAGTKLDYILNLAENTDTIDIDLTVDAGLSTVYAISNFTAQNAGTSAFDDLYISDALISQINALSASNGSPVSNTIVSGWSAITSRYESFARNRRKDHVFISDPLRHVLVTGQNTKTLDDRSKNFSQNVYWPLRNLYGAYNSSYATAYANWVRVTDTFSSKNVWLPFSGYAAAMITASDAANYPWTAPAGLNRGVINGLVDIGINPQQKQRDLLYKVSLNPLVFFPNEGFTVMGQKTLLKAPSAFDRLNVRRLFLFLEKSVLNTSRFFVFEPNTTFTRNRLVNTISPVFTLAKNTQGVFDYLIVCNETNNTADVIDDNTLVVDIYIKPVRTAEFILVNFYATKTSTSFNELIQG